MSWSISQRGSKSYVRQHVWNSKPSHFLPPEEHKQFERVKQVILDTIDEIPDNDAVELFASGSMSVTVHLESNRREITWSSVSLKIEPIRLAGMVDAAATRQ